MCFAVWRLDTRSVAFAVRLAELNAKGAGRSLDGVDRFDGAGASIRTVLARAGIDCIADLWSRWTTTEEFTMTGFEAVARTEVSALT